MTFHRYIPVLVAGVACLLFCGCSHRVEPLAVDRGHLAFLQRRMADAQVSLGQSLEKDAELSRQSSARQKMSGAQRLFEKGEYIPMHRERFLARFYSALALLCERQPEQAFTMMELCQKDMDLLAQQFADLSNQSTQEAELQRVKEENPDAKDQLEKNLPKDEEIVRGLDETLAFQDRNANPALADFYNPAVLLFAAFLEGLEGSRDSLRNVRTCCAWVAEGQAATHTNAQFLTCADAGAPAFRNKLLVIAAVGKGPLLTPHKISLVGLPLFSSTSLLPEKEAMAARNQDFNPMEPLVIVLNGKPCALEPATNMYTNLAAEFRLRAPPMYVEQVSRIALRDLAFVATTQLAASAISNKTARVIVRVGAMVTFLFMRTLYLEPDLRCMLNAPWAYQVALVDIPADRKVTYRPQGQPELTIEIPQDHVSAVLYLDHPGPALKLSANDAKGIRWSDTDTAILLNATFSTP